MIFPWFSMIFPMIFHVFFCLMTGYFCDLAGSRRSRRSSTRLPRASTTCSKLWEISRCLAWNGPWWDDDVGWMKLERNWDETGMKQMLTNCWVVFIGCLHSVTLKWPHCVFDDHNSPLSNLLPGVLRTQEIKIWIILRYAKLLLILAHIPINPCW